MQIILLLEATSSSSATVGEGLDIAGKLGVNTWAFLTQFLAFLFMILIVIKLAYKPVHKFLEQRRQYIKENLDSAAKQNEEAQLAQQEARENLTQSKRQANDILVAAKKQAEEDKSKYEEDLKAELQAKRIAAEKDIQSEKKQALLDARSQMVDIALAASSSLLGREVTTADNKRYVTQFVDEMSEKGTSEANQH
jgi:F-type H+-transporting ATPase subunit b